MVSALVRRALRASHAAGDEVGLLTGKGFFFRNDEKILGC